MRTMLFGSLYPFFWAVRYYSVVRTARLLRETKINPKAPETTLPSKQQQRKYQK